MKSFHKKVCNPERDRYMKKMAQQQVAPKEKRLVWLGVQGKLLGERLCFA